VHQHTIPLACTFRSSLVLSLTIFVHFFAEPPRKEPFLDEKCLTYLCVTCFTSCSNVYSCPFRHVMTSSVLQPILVLRPILVLVLHEQGSLQISLAVAIVLVASKPALASSSLCSALFVLFVPQLLSLSFNSNQRSVINRLSSYLKRERERSCHNPTVYSSLLV